jgi:hypothetical protein
MVFPVALITTGPRSPFARSAYRSRGAYWKPRSWKNKPSGAKSLVSDQVLKMEANLDMPGNVKSFRDLQPFQLRNFEFSNAARFRGGFATEAEKRSQAKPMRQAICYHKDV